MCYTDSSTFLPRGRKFELDVFGHYGEELVTKRPYTPFKTAVSQVIRRGAYENSFRFTSQTKNPKLLVPFLNDINDGLKVTDNNGITIYSAINSNLDYLHSVDGVISFKGKKAYFDLCLLSDPKEKNNVIILNRESFKNSSKRNDVVERFIDQLKQ